MTSMQDIIQKAKEWLIKEVEQNKTPIFSLVEFSEQQGVRLANQLGADINIVKIGSWLIDIKLGEAKKEDKLSEHDQIGADATKIFLDEFDIPEEIKNKIINCVEAHHGKIPYICKEAEICANADCYRFIHPKGVFTYFVHLCHTKENTGEILKQLEYKLDEKWNILSLDICKGELGEHYQAMKKLIAAAKKN